METQGRGSPLLLLLPPDSSSSSSVTSAPGSAPISSNRGNAPSPGQVEVGGNRGNDPPPPPPPAERRHPDSGAQAGSASSQSSTCDITDGGTVAAGSETGGETGGETGAESSVSEKQKKDVLKPPAEDKQKPPDQPVRHADPETERQTGERKTAPPLPQGRQPIPAQLRDTALQEDQSVPPSPPPPPTQVHGGGCSSSEAGRQDGSATEERETGTAERQTAPLSNQTQDRTLAPPLLLPDWLLVLTYSTAVQSDAGAYTGPAPPRPREPITGEYSSKLRPGWPAVFPPSEWEQPTGALLGGVARGRVRARARPSLKETQICSRCFSSTTITPENHRTRGNPREPESIREHQPAAPPRAPGPSSPLRPGFRSLCSARWASDPREKGTLFVLFVCPSPGREAPVTGDLRGFYRSRGGRRSCVCLWGCKHYITTGNLAASMMRKDVNKPKGKTSAYAFFVQTCREEHRKKHPEQSVNFAEFSKKCSERWKVRQALRQTGRETVLRELEGGRCDRHLDRRIERLCSESWKGLTANDKKCFEDMAKTDKVRYNREMVDYTPPKGFGKRGRKRKDPNAPKRPPYLVGFVQTIDTSWGDCAKKLGELWGKQTQSDKLPYEEKAQKLREKYDGQVERQVERERDVEQQTQSDKLPYEEKAQRLIEIRGGHGGISWADYLLQDSWILSSGRRGGGGGGGEEDDEGMMMMMKRTRGDTLERGHGGSRGGDTLREDMGVPEEEHAGERTWGFPRRRHAGERTWGSRGGDDTLERGHGGSRGGDTLERGHRVPEEETRWREDMGFRGGDDTLERGHGVPRRRHAGERTWG
ncbi:hypothetical protein F7725_001394 [Dissostichus mawsoni]|uniref:HMG box domain-containing protein n=1 Tax=Dissostichus mawsoni TaxID=36200 RepID=A0A7J5ZJK8_DISMA|nr:hypothetical protein F7725_001394 [Dissostichus mawsoni]